MFRASVTAASRAIRYAGTALLIAAMTGSPSALAQAQPEVVDIALDTGFQDAFLGHHNKGRACVTADFDDDGLADFFVGNPGDTSFIVRGTRGEGGELRYELGPILFTEDLPLRDKLAWGGAAADYDNDGDRDLYVSVGANEGAGLDKLFRNDWILDGELTGELVFTDVTDEAGIAGPDFPGRQRPIPVASANGVWGDYDNDGFVDLFVSVNIAPPPLDESPPYPTKGRNVLWHNEGDGTFTDVTNDVGLGRSWRRTRHSTWLDMDNDGDLDLYENNFGDEQVLWRNQFSQTGVALFDNVTLDNSLDGESMAWPVNSFASAAADFNNDGFIDLFAFVRERRDWGLHAESLGFHPGDCAAPVSPPPEGAPLRPATDPWAVSHALLINLRGLGVDGFTNVAAAAGLEDMPLPPFNGVMGAQLGDINADGFPDVFVGNGGAGGGRENQLYVSAGVTTTTIEGIGDIEVPLYTNQSTLIDFPAPEPDPAPFEYASYPYRTHGTCMVDVDDDGLLEMAVINGGPSFFPDWVREPNRLFDFDWGAESPSTFTVHVEGDGVEINRDAIGTRLTVLLSQEDLRTWSVYETVYGGRGFSGQNAYDVTFGLARADTIQQLKVTWPDGVTDTFTEGLEPGGEITVVREPPAP